jgi:hypothetical protein
MKEFKSQEEQVRAMLALGGFCPENPPAHIVGICVKCSWCPAFLCCGPAGDASNRERRTELCRKWLAEHTTWPANSNGNSNSAILPLLEVEATASVVVRPVAQVLDNSLFEESDIDAIRIVGILPLQKPNFSNPKILLECIRRKFGGAIINKIDNRWFRENVESGITGANYVGNLFSWSASPEGWEFWDKLRGPNFQEMWDSPPA